MARSQVASKHILQHWCDHSSTSWSRKYHSPRVCGLLGRVLSVISSSMGGTSHTTVDSSCTSASVASGDSTRTTCDVAVVDQDVTAPVWPTAKASTSSDWQDQCSCRSRREPAWKTQSEHIKTCCATLPQLVTLVRLKAPLRSPAAVHVALAQAPL